MNKEERRRPTSFDNRDGKKGAPKGYRTKKRIYKRKQIKLATSNDPIADLLVRIKNAGMRRKDMVIVPHSQEKESILELLRREHYIHHFDVETLKIGKFTKEARTSIKTNKKYFTIYLKYYENIPSIKGIRRISKPGLRVYSKAEELPRVLKGMGIAIVSTSNGIMTDDQARSQNIGGEVLAYIW